MGSLHLDLWGVKGRKGAGYLPDAGNLPQVHVPPLLLALGLDDVEPLGVTADLGGVQRLLHDLYQLRLALPLQVASEFRQGRDETLLLARQCH